MHLSKAHITTAASLSFAPPPPIARSPAVSGPIGVPISMPPSAPSSAPPQGAASTPISPSEPPYRPSPSSLRVEQILLTRDDVLDDITLYWLTNSATSAARIYWETAGQSVTVAAAQKT